MSGQDCKQLILFQGDSPASHIALSENGLLKTMSGICGQSTCALSENLTQNTLLEKTLMGYYQQYMSPYAPTWKQRATKSGRTVYRLVLSERTMKDTGFVFLASPRASQDYKPIRKQTRPNFMQQPWNYLPGTYWAVHYPPVCGMDDGIPDWMGGYKEYKERMQCYGNAVVPQQFYPIFKAIAEIESMIQY